MVKREGGVYAVLHVATRKHKHEEVDVSDGVQLGTLLSLYGVERTYHCTVPVLLPGTLESSSRFTRVFRVLLCLNWSLFCCILGQAPIST